MRFTIPRRRSAAILVGLLLAVAPASAQAPRDAKKATPGSASRLQARVWVNLESGIYHCPTSRYYGEGKKGEYMKEAQARAAGYRAASRRGCDADGDARRVWVNADSKVYHCPSSARFAETKNGHFMSEAAAIAQGYRPAAGRKCT